MKCLLLILALKIITLYQTTFKELRIPEVKESSQIDSLIDKGIPNASPGKSIMLLDIRTSEKPCTIFYSVRATDQSVLDLGIKSVNSNWAFNYKDNLRFFKYKGYWVFVCGATDSFKFFSLKKTFRSFKFLNTYTESEKKDLARSILYLNFSKYENGKIIPAIKGDPD